MGAAQRMAPGPESAACGLPEPATGKGAIHETLVFDGPAVAPMRLAGVVEHHSYPSVADHLQQIERFGAGLGRGPQFAAGRRSSVALALLKVVAQWVQDGLRDQAGGPRWRHRLGHRPAQCLGHLAKTRPPSGPEQRSLCRLRRVLHPHPGPMPSETSCAPCRWSKALKQAYPDVKVDVLVRGYAAPVAHAHLGIDRRVGMDGVRCDRPRPTAGFALDRKGYDDTVVFAFPIAVVRAAHAARIPIRIATGRRWHLAAATHRHVGQPQDLRWPRSLARPAAAVVAGRGCLRTATGTATSTAPSAR